MPKIKVEKNSSLPAKDSYEKIKSFLSNDPDLKNLDSSYQCNFQDELMKGTAKGHKFNADLEVTSLGQESKVQIIVDLPLMLLPFKGLVENTLNKKLTKLLG